ncbi:Uncharacterised protein [Salmonella enterica subsp. enterica]|uniref:Uncharacterized protein n=1 Tax=Salmonella enterica I TaxID=59201 RepID=A0A379WRT1_SALET|nr:Uncharacterised protein [Salmonella enterica subsp. enterica]
MDGCGGNAVASAVFQNQGNSDLRVFIRCKSGIKHMIAQANGDHFRVVGLIFFQAKHLRRAAFGRNAVGRGVKRTY